MQPVWMQLGKMGTKRLRKRRHENSDALQQLQENRILFQMANGLYA